MLVLPGFGEAGEEVVAGDDEDAPLLEAFIELMATNWKVFEPQPEEEGPFRFVDQGGRSL